MEFKTKRFAQLAGITDTSSHTLSEGTNRTKKTRKKSKDTLLESKVRLAIRKEIESLVQEMRETNGGGDWIYSGQKKPGRSRKGQVTMGLLGIGFGAQGD